MEAKKRKKYVRVKQSPNPDNFGYLEMDTVLKVVNGIKFYLYTAVDVRMKFSYAYPYLKLNSRNTVDFFKKTPTGISGSHPGSSNRQRTGVFR